MRLEPLAEAHLAAMDRLIEDPEARRRTLVPDTPPEAFSRSWLDRYEMGRRDGSCEAFAALDDDGTFVGLGLVPVLDREAAEAELGYIVAAEARGRGIGTAILRALTDWVFAQGVLRAAVRIATDNPASVKVAERAGYRREGVLRSVHSKQGERLDMIVMSRLPTD
jgi:RimJ/RimL family protein N-acetyltransferase